MQQVWLWSWQCDISSWVFADSFRTSILFKDSMCSSRRVHVIFIFYQQFFCPSLYLTLGQTIFSHYLLTVTIFCRNIFFHKMCVLIFSTNFLWYIFIIRKFERKLMKNVCKSSCQRAVFLVRFTRNSNFPVTCSKNIHLPSFMTFRPFVQTDRQTWRR